jgi:aryl-alcohol dehydrogenase-like predicted oxidoreductase
MQKRTLGTNGLEVSAIGLGCMSMTGGYSERPDRQEMMSLAGTAVDRD